MTLAGTCGLQTEQQLVQKTKKPLYPKAHRNPLLEGLRPTLEAARVAESQAWVRPVTGRPVRPACQAGLPG